MNEKLKQQQDFVVRFVRNLSDVRFAGQVLFAVIVLLISWSGVKSIQANYNLQKQISALQQQNEVQKLANDNLKLQNQYFNSKQYLELSARQNFNLAAPNEKEILVPKTVALANTVNLPQTEAVATSPDRRPLYQQHYQAWLDFFLHHPNSTN